MACKLSMMVLFFLLAGSAPAAEIVVPVDHMMNQNLETVYRGFEEITSHVQDWDYSFAYARRFKAVVAAVSESDLSRIVRTVRGDLVSMQQIAANDMAFSIAKTHACHSGYVNDHCGDFAGVLRRTLANERNIKVYVGKLIDAHMSYAYVLFYDTVQGEILVLGSAFLHTM